MGANVRKLQTGPIDAVNLSGNEILVISCPRTTFNIQEVIAIGTFVNNGGGLLLITEAGGSGYQCSGILNGISSQFSIYMNNVSAPLMTPSIVSHEVTKDVNSVSFVFSDNLTVVPGSSFPLITSGPGGSSILMAGSEHGLGRVIVIGDTNVWADVNNGLITPDNSQLAVNTISWLGHVNIMSNPTGIAVFRPASGYWYFDNNLDGIVNKSIRFGGSTDQIIAGDWQGTGTDGIAIFRPASGYWYFDYNLDGIVDKSFRYGGAGDKIAKGDWDNDGKDGIALFRPVSGFWYFDNNLDGVVDKSFRYGGSTDQVIAGKWA
jgi:uncharacterized protein YneR